jgi:hypothetical protein
MEIYELLETDGDAEWTVYLNTAHVVAITEDTPCVDVHMSNGQVHHITERDSVSLRTLLHASKSN